HRYHRPGHRVRGRTRPGPGARARGLKPRGRWPRATPVARISPFQPALTARRNPAHADNGWTGARTLLGAARSVSQPSNYLMTESFAELFEASQTNLATLKPGSIVTGVVVQVRTDVVVINAGLKSEGIVPIEQFRND